MKAEAERMLLHLRSRGGDTGGLDVEGVRVLSRALLAAGNAVGLGPAHVPRGSQLALQRGLLRLAPALQDLPADDQTLRMVAWLEAQVDEAFTTLLEGLRLAPGNREAIAGLTGVVTRHLVPWCRLLLRQNPGLLRSPDRIREDAVDEAIHGFLIHLLAGDRRALRDFEGSSIRAFRGWITVAFRNHRVSELRRQDARKRGGDAVIVPLDTPSLDLPSRTASAAARVDARRALEALHDRLSHYGAEGGTEGHDARLFAAFAAEEAGRGHDQESTQDAPSGPRSASGRNRALARARVRIRSALGWERDDS